MIFHKHTSTDGENTYFFYCPACKRGHSVNEQWTFNGNTESPTLGSSVGVNMPKFPNYLPDVDTCHSTITNGNIHFHGDCTHELKGQTMPLPHFPEGYGLP